MRLLKGDNIFLRALETEDLEFLYELENNPDIWEVSRLAVDIKDSGRRVLSQVHNLTRELYCGMAELGIKTNNLSSTSL